MKKVGLTVLILSLMLSFFILKNSIFNFLDNITTSYSKYVLLGGEDITVYIGDKVSNNEFEVSSNTVSASTGILTYIDNKTNTYGAIAHNIKETEGSVSGEIYQSEVLKINKSATSIGNKIVAVNTKNSFGTVYETNNRGIFGLYTNNTSDKELIQLGMPNEVRLGHAYLVTSINDEIKKYKIRITSINMFTKEKNMTIEIIDEDLLNETGGIIKGMSGSPIIQNGKLIGALSHSYSDNFKKGSALFITNMIK